MFSIDVRNMQQIRSYEAAKHYFEQTERPRGQAWADNARPLDSMRKPHMALTRSGNHDNEFACRLYRMALVTYCPDGSVDIAFDNRKSSRLFMDNVLPHGISCHAAHDRTWVCVDGDYYTSSKVLSFKQRKGRWTLLNPEDIWIPNVPRINHKLAIKVRRKLKPFEQWHNAMKRLGALKPICRTWHTEALVQELLERPDDLSLYAKVASVASAETVRTRAYALTGAYVAVPGEPGVIPKKVAA